MCSSGPQHTDAQTPGHNSPASILPDKGCLTIHWEREGEGVKGQGPGGLKNRAKQTAGTAPLQVWTPTPPHAAPISGESPSLLQCPPHAISGGPQVSPGCSKRRICPIPLMAQEGLVGSPSWLDVHKYWSSQIEILDSCCVYSALSRNVPDWLPGQPWSLRTRG